MTNIRNMKKISYIQQGSSEGKNMEYHFPNIGYKCIEELFNNIHNDLKTIIETNLCESKTKQTDFLCSINIIYAISFKQYKLQHMQFYSRKFKIVKKCNIIDTIELMKKNLIAKMNMFCNSNDNNPYYILQKIESVKCIFFFK